MDEGISCNGNGNGDETQRRRLARILRDPTAYYADARREAHAHARRFLAARLRARRV
ncbi:hypothetical protein [Pseudonocardia yunnanensis]|uniref:Uncharacterized protein n=1 Tax=Pseudonocardia yunnanensis TaxID=58107 RepID=A0ABW4ES52_9PSEU